MVVATCLVTVMVLGMLYARHTERVMWNDGVCAATGKPWVRFDTDSQGGRGYRSDDNWLWVSYDVDKHYDHHRATFLERFMNAQA